MAKGKSEPARSGGPGLGFYLILGAVALGGVLFLVLARNGGGGGDVNRPLPAWAGQVEPDSLAGIPLGPEDAPITIAEFADFQCPHCAQFGAFTGRLIRQNYVEAGGQVRWVMYDYLVGFPNSMAAALSARCADEQGRYWPMHDLLLARQTKWGAKGSPGKLFREYAREIGLDGQTFDACFEERRHLDKVLGSYEYGKQLGVQGTPTLFFNGRKLDGGSEMSYEGLERLIKAAQDSVLGARAAADAAGGIPGGGGP
ncbi:MAG: DsbA family protein [Gemmatimonadota bacterium]